MDEKRIDRIINPNKDLELTIPMGYYGILNLYIQNETATKFAVNSLGAGIILILKDDSNKLYALSHTGFPGIPDRHSTFISEPLFSHSSALSFMERYVD